MARSLRPVTIKQLLTNCTKDSDDCWKIDNKEIYMISILGNIEKISYTKHTVKFNRTLKINDYTGTIDVIFYDIKNHDNINYILFVIYLFIYNNHIIYC